MVAICKFLHCFFSKVDGSSGNTYMIYPSVNYCPCPSYKYMVSGGSHFICKHVLATIVADVTKQRIPIEVTDAHFVDLIIQNSLGRSEFTVHFYMYHV